MRSGELGALASDAMVRIGDTHWLRIPVGKLHNDRHVPLHPLVVELINDGLATRPPSRSGRLVERDHGQAFDRRTIHRHVAAAAKRAGAGHVHPHQLRHTLATQAINRATSLEAIAALLGHRSMRMTLTSARISDRTVADDYFRVTQPLEAAYSTAQPTAADVEVPNMRRLAADHRRLLGNGHRTRPVALDCNSETICERCGFYQTGPSVRPNSPTPTRRRHRPRRQRPRPGLHRAPRRHRPQQMNVIPCPTPRPGGITRVTALRVCRSGSARLRSCDIDRRYRAGGPTRSRDQAITGGADVRG
jgi:hypothetical protein